MSRWAGGIGVIGGVRQSPKFLQESINELKSHLEHKDAPFGVDLLIPKIGGGARKTNVRPFACLAGCEWTRTTHDLSRSTITPRASSRSS